MLVLSRKAHSLARGLDWAIGAQYSGISVFGKGKGMERHRSKERVRDKERERQRQRQTQTDRQTDRQTPG